MLNRSLKSQIKEILRQESLRRIRIADQEPDTGLIIRNNRAMALKSLPDDAFRGLYPQLSPIGVTESELKQYIKEAISELEASDYGAMKMPWEL